MKIWECYERIRVLSVMEAFCQLLKTRLEGYFILYPDGTEATIDRLSIKDFFFYIGNDCRFGEEL